VPTRAAGDDVGAGDVRRVRSGQDAVEHLHEVLGRGDVAGPGVHRHEDGGRPVLATHRVGTTQIGLV
jgi:hypothetical protein